MAFADVGHVRLLKTVYKKRTALDPEADNGPVSSGSPPTGAGNALFVDVGPEIGIRQTLFQPLNRLGERAVLNALAAGKPFESLRLESAHS